MNKPAFDPGQPFTPGNKPAFDPSQPFQAAESPTDGSSQMDVAKFALSQAAAMNPVNKLTQMRQNVGGDIAEAGGYLGGKVTSAGFPNVGNAIQRVGVVAGSIPALGPEVLGAYTSLKGLYNPTNPVAAGITNTPKDLSPQYAMQNQAAGISNDIPETAGKVQYENPYQYPSQLSKPKYIPVQQPDLPVIQPGAKTGDPHALFAYNDKFGPGGTERSVYNVFGDPNHPAIQGRGWGSSVSAEDAQAAGIPITGRQPNSIKYQPIQSGSPTYQPIENPNAPAFTRPKLSYPAESGQGAAQPLPSTVPTKYPNDPGALINQINDRIGQHGTNLTPQELSDYHQLLSTKMANGDIPKFSPEGKITPIYAQATQAAQKVTNTLNQVVEPLLQGKQLPIGTLPTRIGLNQAYGIASNQQAFTELAKKYGLKAGETVLGALGAKGLYDYFRK